MRSDIRECARRSQAIIVLLSAFVINRVAPALANEKDGLLMLVAEGAKDNRERIKSWDWEFHMTYHPSRLWKRREIGIHRWTSVSDGLRTIGEHPAGGRQVRFLVTDYFVAQRILREKIVHLRPLTRASGVMRSSDPREVLDLFDEYDPAVQPEREADDWRKLVRLDINWCQHRGRRMLCLETLHRFASKPVTLWRRKRWVDPERGFGIVKEERFAKTGNKAEKLRTVVQVKLAKYGDVWFPELRSEKIWEDDGSVLRWYERKTVALKVNGEADRRQFDFESALELAPGVRICDHRAGCLWYEYGPPVVDEAKLDDLLSHPLVTSACARLGLVPAAPVESRPDVSETDPVRRWYQVSSCGPNCLYLALRLSGIRPGSLDELKEMAKMTDQGCTMKDLLTAARSKGAVVEALKMRWRALRDDGRVALLDWRAKSHFIVVVGFRDDEAIVLDPPKGPHLISKDDLEKLWSGYALVFCARPRGKHSDGDAEKR